MCSQDRIGPECIQGNGGLNKDYEYEQTTVLVPVDIASSLNHNVTMISLYQPSDFYNGHNK